MFMSCRSLSDVVLLLSCLLSYLRDLWGLSTWWEVESSTNRMLRQAVGCPPLHQLPAPGNLKAAPGLRNEGRRRKPPQGGPCYRASPRPVRLVDGTLAHLLKPTAEHQFHKLKSLSRHQEDSLFHVTSASYPMSLHKG